MRVNTEDVPLVEFMYLVFTRMPGESYRRRLRSLLYSCNVFRALSLVGRERDKANQKIILLLLRTQSKT